LHAVWWFSTIKALNFGFKLENKEKKKEKKKNNKERERERNCISSSY
jgi:hypothetical protein